ncbi:MAG: TatD family hydrolase [Oscillospiraceae bacterium]|nr:TatD family hydrolase [Oscillospiraceae bacterium]
MIRGIFDSHAHYDDKAFSSDRDQLIENLSLSGVENVVNIGCDLKTSKASISLGKKHKIFSSTVGFHPHYAKDVDGDYIDILEEMSRQESVVGIGEIGLDYHYGGEDKAIQKRVFINQLKLAERIKKPVVIHSRDALDDSVEILQKFNLEGVIHCFGYDFLAMEKFIDMGYHIGITGVVTFKNARDVKTVVTKIPLDRLLIETDCPYMAPTPFRGGRCDSTMLIHSIEEIAGLRGISPEEVVSITSKNGKKLFKIK